MGPLYSVFLGVPWKVIVSINPPIYEAIENSIGIQRSDDRFEE